MARCGTRQGGEEGAVHRLSVGGSAVSIAVGQQPHALVIDTALDRAYVAVAWSDEVVAVDLQTRVTVGRQLVGALTESVALSPDGARVAVAAADANMVTLLDAETLAVEARVEVPGRPVCATFTGRMLFVSLGNAASLAAIDPATETVEAVIAVGQLPDGTVVEPSGRYDYIANADSQTISVVDLGRLEVVAELPTEVGMSGLIWRTAPIVALRS